MRYRPVKKPAPMPENPYHRIFTPMPSFEDLVRKAGDTIDIQKKKNEIYGLKRDSERDMTEIGRLVYERFKQGEVVDTDFIALCEAIEKREEQTEVCEQEIARIKGE